MARKDLNLKKFRGADVYNALEALDPTFDWNAENELDEDTGNDPEGEMPKKDLTVKEKEDPTTPSPVLYTNLRITKLQFED